ncbi:MAG: DEAD/DEAH box helicase family protein [Planctomycetaceae bacterium]|nr:DEAD/DEAH box helicase family protein [Planctomycetaceae bacterium]
MQLRDYQQAAIDAVYDYLRNKDGNPCVVLPTGCHAKGHPILMFDGSVKPIENVLVDDLVMGPDSKPRRVLQLCRGNDEMFRIQPIKGEPFIVNGGHILSLVCTREGKPYPCHKQGGEIDNISVREYMTKSKSWKHLRKLYHVPIDFASTPDLPIPPYILGLMLGDGSFRDDINLTTKDVEIERAWCDYATSIGCEVSVDDDKVRCPTYSIVGGRGKEHLLIQILTQFGLMGQKSGTKFIPQLYLVASREERLKLLAGLMDSDGHMAHGFFDYITKSMELASDIAFLARSLGFFVYVRSKYCLCQTGGGGWYYRVSICGDCSVIPCRLQRKQYPGRRQIKNVLRSGFIIEQVGRQNYYGFTLDGDHLYVDGQFMVHHNSGKTPLLSAICMDAVTMWNGRVLVLAHVKELLEQSATTLRRIAPNLPVGVYSAGLNSRDTNEPVIVAGIQSVYTRADELGHFDLVIIDEAHLIPPDGEGMYQTFLTAMREINPLIRLIGLTATPYRMKSGLLCGPDNLLHDICFEIGVKELIEQKYLCPLKTKGGRSKVDCSNLHIRAGEFIAAEVEELMNNTDLVASACREIIMQTKDRHSVLIFASSVAHAEHVKETIEKYSGVECGLITGDTPSSDRETILKRFKGEKVDKNLFGDPLPRLKYLVNVNVLTTGFDAPNVDCVVLLRPTASPGLYYQCCGRGFRLHESKQDCLVLDYGGNIMRHGPVDAIKVKDVQPGSGDAPVKECPECQTFVHAAIRHCPECGHEFPEPEKEQHDAKASSEGILTGQIIDTEYEVNDVFYSVHTKRGAGEDVPKTFRIDYQTGFCDRQSEWLCPEHNGWARKKFEKWWREHSNDPLPETAQEAVDIANGGGLATTQKITVRKVTGEHFDRIIKYELGEKPEGVAANLQNLDAWGEPLPPVLNNPDDDIPF